MATGKKKRPPSPADVAESRIPPAAETASLFSCHAWYMCLDCCHVVHRVYENEGDGLVGELAFWCPECENGRCAIAHVMLKAIYV
jgi:hypothetical protein